MNGAVDSFSLTSNFSCPKHLPSWYTQWGTRTIFKFVHPADACDCPRQSFHPISVHSSQLRSSLLQMVNQVNLGSLPCGHCPPNASHSLSQYRVTRFESMVIWFYFRPLATVCGYLVELTHHSYFRSTVIRYSSCTPIIGTGAHRQVQVQFHHQVVVTIGLVKFHSIIVGVKTSIFFCRCYVINLCFWPNLDTFSPPNLRPIVSVIESSSWTLWFKSILLDTEHEEFELEGRILFRLYIHVASGWNRERRQVISLLTTRRNGTSVLVWWSVLTSKTPDLQLPWWSIRWTEVLNGARGLDRFREAGRCK